MTDAERDDAIAQARRLKAERPSLSLHRAAVALAGQRGRSVEAMRKLLEKRASDAFPERRGPLDARAKRLIARAIRMGVPVAQIAHRLGKSRHTIHRAALQHRAHLARQRRLDHVALPTFHREDADEVLLGHTLPLEPDPQRRAAIVEAGDLPPEVQPLYRAAAYADRTLHALFVRYNYVKFRAAAIREGFGRYQPRAGDLDRFESLAATADDLRSRIAHAQFPVVLSVVRRHLVGRPATASRVVELLKLGHGVLYEAIESYDPSRAQTFDAYLRNRLLRRLAGETDSEAARAHRRVDGPAVLREMQRQANEHGVTLTIPPISGTPGDAGD